MASIHFFAEDVTLPFENFIFYQNCFLQIISDEHCVLKELNYIFCSDEYLFNINEQFLNHSYFTDVITFNHSDESSLIEGDIYISLHRILDNSEKFSSTFILELQRVMIHGLLHLIGYNDVTTQDQKFMRFKENLYLPLFVP